MDQQKDSGFNGQSRHGQSQGPSDVLNRQKKDSNENAFAYIKRKAEKLTTALYLVTDIMSDKEPIKWRARETGLETLSDIMVAGTANSSERVSSLRDVMRKIEKIVAFLDVAQSTRMMTEMNASMLKKEYVALKESVEEEWSRIAERSRSVLTESFFELPPAPQAATKKVDETIKQNATIQNGSERDASSGHAPFPSRFSDANHKRQEHDRGNTKNVERHESPRPLQSSQASRQLQNGPLVQAGTPNSKMETTLSVTQRPQERPSSINSPLPAIFNRPPENNERSEVARTDRRKIILALIKQKPALTVKDISKSISHVSEKTIQRELLAMVGEGVLIKRGERRWSTYALR